MVRRGGFLLLVRCGPVTLELATLPWSPAPARGTGGSGGRFEHAAAPARSPPARPRLRRESQAARSFVKLVLAPARPTSGRPTTAGCTVSQRVGSSCCETLIWDVGFG